jgi:hypothetical protein
MKHLHRDIFSACVHWAFLMVVLLVLTGITSIAHAQVPALTFTLESTSPDGKTVVPRLTWSTTPGGAACAATGSWTGAKAASGTEVLAAIATSQSYTIKCDWPDNLTPTVNWVAPTTNVDGSAYTNPGGFRVQYGKSSTNLDTSVSLTGPALTSWKVTPPLTPGGWCFSVRAVNALGLESELFSPPRCAQYGAGSTDSRTLNLGITVPSSPTGVTVK